MRNKIYYKEIDNKIVFYNEESIILGEWRIHNPTNELLEEAGWKEYIPKDHPIPGRTLNLAKEERIALILEYDTSSAVNEFFIEKDGNIISFWGNKNDRASLRTVVEDYINLGLSDYRLDIREGGISIVINCHKLLDILSQLEIYAALCYNTTTDHIYTINSLETVEEVDNYDYTKNYPQKLTFNID